MFDAKSIQIDFMPAVLHTDSLTSHSMRLQEQNFIAEDVCHKNLFSKDKSKDVVWGGPGVGKIHGDKVEMGLIYFAMSLFSRGLGQRFI